MHSQPENNSVNEPKIHSRCRTGTDFQGTNELALPTISWLSAYPCAAALMHCNGTVIAVNSAAASLFETEENQLVGKPLFEFPRLMGPNRRETLGRDDSLAASRQWAGFRKLRSLSGETHVLLCSAMVVETTDFASRCVVEVFQTVPEGISDSNQTAKLAAFPHWNPNPVLEFSSEGLLTYCNKAATELASSLGWPDIVDILPSSTQSIVSECLLTGKPRLRLEIPHGDRVISWSFFPIIPLNVVHCYAGEVTERHRLELQFRQSQKLESLGRLAGGIAHDFNNLLTVIRGHASFVASGNLASEALVEALDQIQLAADRGSRLTRQLLTFSRQQVVQFGNSDLVAIVQHVQKLLARVVGEHIQIQLRTKSPLPAIWADASMIEQVLINLAVNSRDAMPSGGQIVIETDVVDIGPDYVVANPDASPGMTICLSFRDTGTGIAPAHLPRIFEPFFTTKDVGTGTGLGLATVYGIVKQHRGWIRVFSELGRGTTFQIHFPESAGASAEGVVPRETSPAPVARGETVLVVEDEPPVRNLIVNALRHQGYKVHEAASGAAALQVWDEIGDKIDLLLTDIVMPGGINGRELALRLNKARPELRVLLITGYSPDVMNESLLKKGAFSLLPKPFDFEELAKAVRNALAARQRSEA